MSTPQAAPPTGPGVTFALVCYILWKVVTFAGLAPIYCSVIAAGLGEFVPALGQKIYKLPVPGFAVFARYQETRRLDLAMFLAVFLLLAVWNLWVEILRLLLNPAAGSPVPGWDPGAYKRIVLALGSVILGADGALFYASVSQAGWGGARLSVTALLATAAYLAVVIFVSLISLTLKARLPRQQ